MEMKSVFIIGALALASLNVASAKTYDITLGAPTRVGNAELKAGQYKVRVDGSQVVFTNAQNAKLFTVQVKIENNATRFEQTTIHSDSRNGTDSLREIDLGGSTTKLEFGE